jgi:hypothetical protein
MKKFQFQKFSSLINLKDVTCPDGKSKCSQNSTCCPNKENNQISYSCCPYNKVNVFFLFVKT